jgi:hypothetical protein
MSFLKANFPLKNQLKKDNPQSMLRSTYEQVALQQVGGSVVVFKGKEFLENL